MCSARSIYVNRGEEKALRLKNYLDLRPPWPPVASSASDSLVEDEALTDFLNLVMGTLFRRGSSGEILCLIFVPSERVLTAQYTLFFSPTPLADVDSVKKTIIPCYMNHNIAEC